MNKQSLLTEAFEVLLDRLGAKKAAQVWRILIPPHGDYLEIRKKIFAGIDSKTLDREIRKFNRRKT